MGWHNKLLGSRKLAFFASLAPFIAGILVGFLIASALRSSQPTLISLTFNSADSKSVNLNDSHTVGSLTDVDVEEKLNNLTDIDGPIKDVKIHASNTGAHALENKSLAEQLYSEVRVLCWVMTNPKNHESKARHVKRTWGKRCNKLLFMSTANDTELESIALPIKEGRNNTWTKTKEAFKYIHKHHMDDADWFFKADDDTYAVVENLRYMLYPYSTNDPLYFGFKFHGVKQGYMSGGAGYVLSKESVRRFVENGIPNKNICKQTGGSGEDLELGRCLEKLNVFAGDSRDSLGRGRFFPFVPETHLFPVQNPKFWYWG